MSYLILIISLVGIVFGAEFLVAGSVSVARRYKVSDFVIGAAIVGIGTSMPELVVSFFGALKGSADVAIGNVVGSNIFNVLGILGLTAICFPIAIDRKNMTFEIPLCIAVSVILTLLALNFFNGTPATIGRVDGIILLLLFVGYMWYSFARDRNEPTPDPSLKGRENDEEIQCILPVCQASDNLQKRFPYWQYTLYFLVILPSLEGGVRGRLISITNERVIHIAHEEENQYQTIYTTDHRWRAIEEIKRQ